MNIIIPHNLILPKYLRIVKEKGSRISKTRAREGGASVFTSFILSFFYSVPPSARKKFWPSNQAGKKEGGWGEGIFARPSVQFLSREARQSVGVSFKKGSSFVQ